MAISDDHDHQPSIDDPSHPHNAPLSDVQLRVRALESLLVEKGLVDPAALDQLIDEYETRMGPHNGARVVALAWTDPDFKARLLQDATGALADLGLIGAQGEHVVVLENTPAVHRPMRPDGTDDMSQDELAALVTRDSMIGTGIVQAPQTAP
jgi:nitrile hydratase